jgi:dipeptidyl aminopeptidase/acylaminoacyl peptidase
MTPKFRKLAAFGLTSLVVLLTLSFGISIPYLKAYNLIHPERTTPWRTPADVGLAGFQVVEFSSRDGLNLRGWYIPSKNGAVVIFVHGHGANRSELLDQAALTTARGYGALLFDLRNHGESQGDRTSMGLSEVDDVKGAVEFVRVQPGVDPAKIALFGHSMGAAAVLMAAAQMPEIGAVLAQSTYSSIEDNIANAVKELTGLPPFPFAPLVIFFGQYEAGVDIHAARPVDTIGQISPRPVLIIHGAEDGLFNVQNAHHLYEAAGEPKQLYIAPHVAHGGFLQVEPAEYPRRILAFLDQYLLNTGN